MSLFTDQVLDYGDPVEEARYCRQGAALFDFSFVYRVSISGLDAISALHRFQPRAIDDMAVGEVRYSLKTDEHGGVRSDLTIWRCGNDLFEVMSGHSGDVPDLLAYRSQPGSVADLSDETAILALQGPGSLGALEGKADIDLLSRLRYFHFVDCDVAGIPCRVGRLGYTGEKGFELICRLADKGRLWESLATSARPAGFTAINILRIEAGFMLFTNECQLSPSPFELGMQRIISTGSIIRRYRLVAFTGNPARRRQQLSLSPRLTAIPMPGQIAISSACYSPYFHSWIGLGFVHLNHSDDDAVDPQGLITNIRIAEPPLYDHSKQIPRANW